MRNQPQTAARSYAAAAIRVDVTTGNRHTVHLALVDAGLNGNEVRRMSLREMQAALRWAVMDGRLTEEDAARACVGIAPRQLDPVGPGRGDAPEGPLGRRPR